MKVANKNIINSLALFPKLFEKLSCLEIEFIKSKPVFDHRYLKSNHLESEFSLKSNTNNNFLDEILSFPVQYENEYISKTFQFYSQNEFLLCILISNFYKIFFQNLQSTRANDFYQLLILICPDFPKTVVKKANLIYLIIKSKNKTNIEQYNDLDFLANEVNPLLFFIILSYCLFFKDFAEFLEKLFNVNYDTGDINDEVGWDYVLHKALSFVGRLPKPEILLEVLISCNKDAFLEHQKNTINFMDEVMETIAKTPFSISFANFMEKFIFNFALLNDFFKIDNKLQLLDSVLSQSGVESIDNN